MNLKRNESWTQTLDRFDDSFLPIVVPHELSVVKQLPIAYGAYVPYAEQYFCQCQSPIVQLALQIFLFADFSIEDNLADTPFAQTYFRKLY